MANPDTHTSLSTVNFVTETSETAPNQITVTSTTITNPLSASSGFPKGAIGGIVGGFLGLLAIIALVFAVLYRRKRQPLEAPSIPYTEPKSQQSHELGDPPSTQAVREEDRPSGALRYPDLQEGWGAPQADY